LEFFLQIFIQNKKKNFIFKKFFPIL